MLGGFGQTNQFLELDHGAIVLVGGRGDRKRDGLVRSDEIHGRGEGAFDVTNFGRE